jgi:ABC-type sugar transport system ATPase subunit
MRPACQPPPIRHKKLNHDAIAMARFFSGLLVLKPQLLLMDEPLSNLDAALSRRLRAEILRLHAELGFTLVFVTHGQEEAQEIGMRTIELGESRAF